MNKEELIERLKENGAWCTEIHTGEKDRYVKMTKAREIIKRLDEPQKVKIPRFIANHLIDTKGLYTLRDSVSRFSIMTDEVAEWLSEGENQDLFARAWLDGYEVEKDPTWVVKYNDYGEWYFTNWSSDSEELPVMKPDGTSIKHDAYKFTDKSKAEALALLIDGTVEDAK